MTGKRVASGQLRKRRALDFARTGRSQPRRLDRPMSPSLVVAVVVVVAVVAVVVVVVVVVMKVVIVVVVLLVGCNTHTAFSDKMSARSWPLSL